MKIEDGVLVSVEKDIKECVIPDSVTSIGNCAFSGCKNLESVVISEKTNISDTAFYGCSKLKEIKKLEVGKWKNSRALKLTKTE